MPLHTLGKGWVIYNDATSRPQLPGKEGVDLLSPLGVSILDQYGIHEAEKLLHRKIYETSALSDQSPIDFACPGDSENSDTEDR